MFLFENCWCIIIDNPFWSWNAKIKQKIPAAGFVPFRTTLLFVHWMFHNAGSTSCRFAGIFFFIPWLCLKRWEMHEQGVCCYQAYRYKISTTPPSSSCFGVKGKTSLWGGCVGTGALRCLSSSSRLCGIVFVSTGWLFTAALSRPWVDWWADIYSL